MMNVMQRTHSKSQSDLSDALSKELETSRSKVTKKASEANFEIKEESN
jgi:hypothetical protein